MALEDKLSELRKVQLNMTAEKVMAKRIEEEAQALLPVRQQIQDLKNQKEELESLSSSLEQQHADTTESFSSFKQIRSVVSNLYNKYKDVLEGEGINKKSEFIHSAEYKDDEEIAEYQTAGEAWNESSASLRSIKNKIEATNPSIKTQQTNVALENIKIRLAELDQEISVLEEQTPEGKLVKQEKVKSTITERIKAERRPDLLNLSGQLTQEVRLVETEDVTLAQTHGEALVKGALLEGWSQEAEADAAKEGQKQGLDVIAGDLNKIDQQVKKFDQASDYADKLTRKWADTISRFTAILESNPDVLERLKKYTQSGSNAQHLAESYLKHIAAFGTERHDDPLDWVQKIFKDKAALIQEFKNHPQASILIDSRMRERGSYPTQLPDVENILEYLKFLEQFLDNFVIAVEQDPTGFEYEKPGDTVKQVFPTERKHESYNRNISLQEITGTSILKNGYNGSKADLKKRELELAGRVDLIKAQLPDAIEVQWARQQLHDFDQQHRGFEVLKIQERVLKAEQAEANKALPLIESAEIKLSGYQDQVVTVQASGGERYHVEFKAMSQELKTLDETNKQIEAEIGQLKKTISEKARESGMLNWLTKSKDRALKELDDQVEAAKNNLLANQKKRTGLGNASMETHQVLYPIVSAAGVGKQIENQAMPLAQLLEQIRHQLAEVLKRQLPAADQALLGQYEALETKKANAEQAYKRQANGSR